MPRVCTICTHPDREAIDKALAEHRPFTALAATHDVSRDALMRHHDNHLPKTLLKAQEAAEAAHANTVLGHATALRNRALGILDKAEGAADLRTACMAIREARACVELLGRLAGELKDQAAVNLFVSPDWQALQTAVLATLEPYPEAREAVVSALLPLERGHVGAA